MSTFTPYTGSLENVDKDLLDAAIKKLATRFFQHQNTFLHSITQTTPTTLHTVSSVLVEPDDLITIESQVWWSASNSADRFRLRHTLGGTATATAEQAQVQAAVLATHGVSNTVTVISNFQDVAAGTYNVALQAWSNYGAPTGVWYSQIQTTRVYVRKRGS